MSKSCLQPYHCIDRKKNADASAGMATLPTRHVPALAFTSSKSQSQDYSAEVDKCITKSCALTGALTAQLLAERIHALLLSITNGVPSLVCNIAIVVRLLFNSNLERGSRAVPRPIV